MKILYVAKHNSGGNDEEGAIAHALRGLGHEVVLLLETSGHQAALEQEYRSCDLLLFHKWRDPETLKQLDMTKCFWYFDLVRYPDETLKVRNFQRMEWMREITPLVDVGFCTDGDWVHTNPNSGRLKHLLQGADLRIAKKLRLNGIFDRDVLLTASRSGGQGRTSFVDEMRSKYDARLFWMQKGCHGEKLNQLVGRSRIVVAPDHPATDFYWSNRVYLMLGFGAFLLHPRCKQLERHYTHMEEIVYYDNRDDLHNKIEAYLRPNQDQERNRIAENGFQRTIKEHNYTTRCTELLASL